MKKINLFFIAASFVLASGIAFFGYSYSCSNMQGSNLELLENVEALAQKGEGKTPNSTWYQYMGYVHCPGHFFQTMDFYCSPQGKGTHCTKECGKNIR